MKTLMNYSVIVMIMIAILGASTVYAQNKKIPITTKSEQAKELYLRGQDAWEKVHLSNFYKLNQKAYMEDPNFFMAYNIESFFNLYFKGFDDFKISATKAIHVKSKLSKGEKLMQNALKDILENPEADVRQYGEQLVKAYPDDWYAYYMLCFYQMFNKDEEGAKNTLEKSLKVAERPAIIYNSLVYSYLSLGQFEDAKKAADKYIELEPGWANVYDTKGDYFMAVKMYGSAYDQFAKAYEINSDFTGSKEKELKAMRLMNEETLNEFELPKLFLEQKWARAASNLGANMLASIVFAKSKGATPEEYGKYVGELHAHYWDAEGQNPVKYFINGMYKNMISFDDFQMEILEQSESYIKAKMDRKWEENFSWTDKYGATMDEFNTCMEALWIAIADKLGLEYSQLIEENQIIIGLTKKQ